MGWVVSICICNINIWLFKIYFCLCHCRYKDNKEINHSEKYALSYENDTYTLTVNDVEVLDEGKYRCEAYNIIDRVSTEAKITVHSKSPY